MDSKRRKAAAVAGDFSRCRDHRMKGIASASHTVEWTHHLRHLGIYHIL